MQVSQGDLLERYSLCEQIGSGAFGSVYRAIHKATNLEVAIKMVLKSTFQNPDAKMHFDNEIKIALQLNHPLISQIYEIIESEDKICAVYEYAMNGDLLHYVNMRNSLNESEARRIFAQLVVAIQYLHENKKIAHRDIKPENILFDKNFNIKLIDFGFSRTFDNNIFFESICGSPAYVAPEIVTGKKYNATADIWSLGVVLYAMVVGQLPFEGDDIKEQLKKVAYSQPVYPTKLSHALIDLLTRLLEKDPMRRISLGKIKIHPWINGFEEVDQIFSSFKPTAEKVEKDVIYQMNLLGIGTNDIEQQIVLNQINNQTISYKLLQRTKQMRSLCRTPTKAVINYRESKHLTPLIRTRNLPTRNPDSTRNRNLNKIQSKNRENDPTVANIDKGKIPSIIASTNKPIKSPQKSFNKTPFFQKKKMIQDNTFTPRFSRF